ncbi:hypothetical protein MLD38_003882 [Melastoma candidum]|uniref:Uncharacterized protein n=1 Tax=Melastoma candidum TaxID=119954 RepID=A0ACB9S7T7_9MYRT|nr:hypothetical protein MLD38_003882 [Melastoma candidum]
MSKTKGYSKARLSNRIWLDLPRPKKPLVRRFQAASTVIQATKGRYVPGVIHLMLALGLGKLPLQAMGGK